MKKSTITLIEKYNETFDDMFPTMDVGDEEDIIKEIKKCLKTGEPYRAHYSDGRKI